MKKGKHPAYGATVTITGQGQAISGGVLVGCAMGKASPLEYAYVFQGSAYPVTGAPEATWSVTVNGAEYSFPSSQQGKSWTAEVIEVTVLPITINGIECGHSPGCLIYWPAAVDPSGYVDAPTSGSNGVYFDVHNDFHIVEFRTTWSVPDFQTVFTWNNTDPFGGPYASPTPHPPAVGDADTWVAGEPPPGGDEDTRGTE